VLELAILGMLKEQELHGYELKKRLTEALGPFSSVSFGSLYPALSRLEASGAVKAVEAEPAAARPRRQAAITGSIAGEAAAFRHRLAGRRTEPRSSRPRKVYGITGRGEQLFDELLLAESVGGDDDRVFNLKLAFCRYLPSERRLGLLERRRAQLVERLARSASNARTHHERLDTYTRSLLEHANLATEADIDWIDSLIAGEQAGSTKGTDK